MKSISENGKYEVVWPRGKRRDTESNRYAQRLDTLEGKTICELSHRVFHADEMFSIIEKELTSRYPGLNFVSYEEFGNIHGGDEGKVIASLDDKFRQNKCDAVISGVGC
ncbi:hypothetical protein ACFLUZ_01470 [Chloroflexota bacterium]